MPQLRDTNFCPLTTATRHHTFYIHSSASVSFNTRTGCGAFVRVEGGRSSDLLGTASTTDVIPVCVAL